MQKSKAALEAQEHYSIGRVYLERGEPERALGEFTESLEIEADGVNSLIGMGQCLLALRRVEEAVPALEKAVGLAPDFADAHYNLGRAYMELNQRERAINEFKEALNINPRYHSAKNHLNALMKAADARAQARDREAEPAAPDEEHISRQANIHFHMGNALFQKNMLKEALVEFKEAVRLRPNYPDIRNRLGDLYIHRAQYSLAEEEFLMALKINPKYVAALLNLADCYRMHSEQLLQKAEESYHRVLQMDPESAKASRGLEIVRSIKNIDFV
jgi:tetratricopeptide (TPR) repeat protein